MRAQKRLVIGLCGISCTGKSAIAKALATLLDCNLRSVGDAIRARSKEKGISHDALTLSDHQTIDDTTRHFAQSGQSCLIIDGTFLDALLSDMRNVIKIELTCEDAERRRRFASREGNDGIQIRDDCDRQLRYSLHGSLRGETDLKIDTTSKTPNEVAREIILWLQTYTTKT